MKKKNGFYFACRKKLHISQLHIQAVIPHQ
uniref:Uncharacterized protein n=1 Tax=Anopheles atroparvus TaxID=41427 RepID=A0AAG5DRY8_ANOAO